MGRKGKWNNCRYMEFLKQDIAIFYRICYIEIGDCMKLDIENLKLLNVLQCVSSPRRIFQNRPSNALVFRRSGSIEYELDGSRIRLDEGQVMLLPKGASFSVTHLTPDRNHYTVINFQGHFAPYAPRKLCPQRDMSELYDRLDQCCTLDPEKDRYLLLSRVYWILSRLFEAAPAPYHSTETLDLIDPAVEQLQKRLFDPGLKVGQLHDFCGISDTYFRALFIARFGVSSKKYVLERRLNQARNLLSSGECANVSEAARMSGFEDALYFSKVFKARYGYCPSHTSHK